jgi:uncharacterized damage-inducible protein DinB
MSVTAEQLAQAFLRHRRATEELARRLPDGGVDFRPWDGAMTAGELLNHMAGSHHSMLAIATGAEVQRPDPASLPRDLPGIRRRLAQLTEEDEATLRGLSEERLGAPRKGFRDMVLPAAAWIQAAREHEAHHKGQLFVYARMQGVEPPSFVQL